MPPRRPPRTRWEERIVHLPSLSLHLREIVEPAAPPILLLHGLGVSGAVWQAFGRRLAPNFAALAPDLRGHGASDPAPPETGYAHAEYASDLADLLAGLSTPLPVVGHSLGALVAVALAARYPALVSHVALLDPPIDAERRNRDIPEVYRLRHAEPGELENYLLAGNPAGGAMLAQVLAGLHRKSRDGAFEAALAEKRGRPEVWEQACTIAVPVLLVQADPAHGGVIRDEVAQEFVGSLQNGQLRKFEGAAHAVHATHANELAETLLTFLA